MLLRVKDTEKITVSGYEQAKSYQRILIFIKIGYNTEQYTYQ